MSTNLNIKDQFIVDSGSYLKEKLEKLASLVIKHAKVNKAGEVLIERQNLSTDEKLKLCLVARAIAHSFEESIPEQMSLSELVKVIGNERIEAIGSRLSQLTKSGFSKKTDRGKYAVHPHQIERFLLSIDNNDQNQANNNHTPVRNVRSKTKQGKPTGGVGKDIKELIDRGFFETPKTIREVKEKLEEEVKYHDIRVLDATIRKVYVLSKKLLKRLRNESEGKSRWQYVIRK